MTLEWLKTLIVRGESETLELKSSTGQRTAAGKTACGMLNGKGGTILFGVAPDGTPTGQQVSDATLRSLTAELARIEPTPIVDVETVPVTDSQTSIIVVQVPGRTGLFTFDRRPYIRRNSTTTHMPAHQYELRVAEKLHGNIRWENQPATDIGLDDLDAEEIQRCIRAGQSIQRLPENIGTDLLTVLQHFRLADKDGSVFNGAVALFARRDRLTARTMQLGIRLARFRGITNTANFSRDSGNPIPEWEERCGTLVITFRPVADRATERSTPQVTPQVAALLRAIHGEQTREELQHAVQLADREHFRRQYLVPALHSGLIEMTIPEKLRSSNQKYRLTEKGRAALESTNPETCPPKP